MPRVAHHSASRAQATGAQAFSPMKIPLNDDRQEKAVRFQSRQALHDLHLNQIKAAASPVRKVTQSDRPTTRSPRTPQTQHDQADDDEERGSFIPLVPGGAMTPLKRVPILANFEEWMKMATDNKINATNSWNFALIDYFHDMSLLREGDGVNFQKASCTLDGCVKIYTSRVDSVATETGKLLSGLADSDVSKGSKKSRQNEDGDLEAEDEDEEIDGENGVKRRTKKKIQRSSEATLAQSFGALQLKKFELEFSVDPLFKKASADFDEGGAKGLLLNHLTIDAQGRIVFDSSEDQHVNVNAPSLKDGTEQGSESAHPAQPISSRSPSDLAGRQGEIDLESLRSKFFPSLELLDDQDVCSSLKNFDLGNPTSTLDIPHLKEATGCNSFDGGKDDMGALSGVDIVGTTEDESTSSLHFLSDAGFGDGGEIWASNNALESQSSVQKHPELYGEEGNEEERELDREGFGLNEGSYGITFGQPATGDDKILSYFDNTLRKNWAGPEHWKIRRIRDTERPITTAPKRKDKEIFEIDFLSSLDMPMAESIYTQSPSALGITMPKAQQTSKNRNLLPDDRHFSSKQLLELFLKPRASLGRHHRLQKRLYDAKRDHGQIREVNEAFWAQQDGRDLPKGESPKPDYDANFFQDDPIFPSGEPQDEEDDFADAREAFSPDSEAHKNPGEDLVRSASDAGDGVPNFSSQLVTQSSRSRPEYVQFAKVAKKVDVRRLKEEMWRGIGPFKKSEQETNEDSQDEALQVVDETLKFTSVMKGLQQVYPKQVMQDISTSYCFICLLHLANEKGLDLSNDSALQELRIGRKGDIASGAEDEA